MQCCPIRFWKHLSLFFLNVFFFPYTTFVLKLNYLTTNLYHWEFYYLLQGEQSWNLYRSLPWLEQTSDECLWFHIILSCQSWVKMKKCNSLRWKKQSHVFLASSLYSWTVPSWYLFVCFLQMKVMGFQKWPLP